MPSSGERAASVRLVRAVPPWKRRAHRRAAPLRGAGLLLRGFPTPSAGAFPPSTPASAGAPGGPLRGERAAPTPGSPERHLAMNPTKSPRPPTHAIPVYEVRLVRSRRPLRLAEECIADGRTSARVLHTFIGLTDREHLACLFVNGQNRVTGAHVVAIGGQHRISDVDVRVILRAALAACSAALILGHTVTPAAIRRRAQRT
ncbi:MAG: JAB domain-containing protein [Polyangiaceae bacterium]